MNLNNEYEIIHHTNMNLLEIFLVEVTAREPHGHSDLELGLILDGSILLFIDGKQMELKTGDIYIINRYQIHSFSAISGNLILAFQIHADFYRNIADKYEFLHFDKTLLTPYFEGHSMHKQLISCAQSYFDEAAYHEILCSGLLYEILHQILTQVPCSVTREQASVSAKNNSLRLERMLDYLAKHYSDPVTLQDIADLEKISIWHASHFITDMIGISFQEYLNNLRFDHALQLLESTNLTLQDICLETGFSSSRYLNQIFRHHFGCTAREYRKLPHKPAMISRALPTENIQTRYPFEWSGQLLKKYT